MNLRKIKQIILGYAIKKECPLNLSNTYNLFTFSPLLSSDSAKNVKDESYRVKGKREKGLKLNTLIQKLYLLYSLIVKLIKYICYKKSFLLHEGPFASDQLQAIV